MPVVTQHLESSSQSLGARGQLVELKTFLWQLPELPELPELPQSPMELPSRKPSSRNGSLVRFQVLVLVSLEIYDMPQKTEMGVLFAKLR